MHTLAPAHPRFRRPRAVLAGLVALAGAALVAAPHDGRADPALTGTITLHHDQDPATGYTADSGGGGEIGTLQFDGTTVADMGAAADVASTVFQTFCLETNETLPRDVVLNWTLGTHAKAGGSGGGGPDGDPLAPESAYLFTQFWNGALTGYDYTLGQARKDSAFQLQLAIWVLEDEFPEGNLDPAGRAASWLAEARAATAANGTWTVQMGAGSLGDVRVLTLTTADGTMVQDVLVVVDTPPPPPPQQECFDFFTGGGFLFETPTGARGNFGVGGGVRKGKFWGHLNFVDHSTRPGMHVKGLKVTSYEVVDEFCRRTTGTYRIGAERGTYTLEVCDHGEPGVDDTFSLTLSNGYVASGTIDGGNIQLHKRKKRC